MINFSALGVQYTMPEQWSDITFAQYLRYLELQKEAPEKLFRFLGGGTFGLSSVDLRACYSYMAKIVECFCGINYDVTMAKGGKGMAASDLQKLWYNIEMALKKDYEYSYEQFTKSVGKSFTFEGVEYFIPTEHLSGGTVGELVLAQTIQEQCKQLENGNYKVLPKLAAIFCRRKDEWYDDYNIEERAKKFEQLTMDVLLFVGFFLRAYVQTYATDLHIFTSVQTLTKLRQVSNNYTPNLEAT